MAARKTARSPARAESAAPLLPRLSLGIAIAAMIPMITITMTSSIRLNPRHGPSVELRADGCDFLKLDIGIVPPGADAGGGAARRPDKQPQTRDIEFDALDVKPCRRVRRGKVCG